MGDNLELSLLAEMATFTRVVESGSFSEAGRQLGMTKSAVSRQVSRLESALGTRLLMRTTRRLHLTEAGEAVYQACGDMVAAARAATEAAGRFSEGPRGLLRVSAPMAYGKIRLAPLLPEFLARYPDVDVQLVLSERIVDLVEDGMDVAIRIAAELAPGLAARRLAPLHYLLCSSGTYLAAHAEPVQPADLANHNCLHLGHGPFGARWQFERNGQRAAVSVRGRLTVNHSEAMLEAVRRGVGIGMMPAFTADAALQTGEVRAVLPDWRVVEPYLGTVWAVYHPTRHLAPKTRVFIDFLVEALGNPRGEG